MPRPRPYGSLAFRLLLLAAVPYIGLTVLAVQRIRVEQDDRRHAEALIEIVQLRQAVVSAYAPKQVERIALEGMSRIDDLGLPRPLVIAATGIDFEQLEHDNHRAFDEALDDLAARFGTIVLADGSDLDHRLGTIRGDLDRIRLEVDAAEGDVTEVRTAFDRLDATLTEVLSLERTLDGDVEASPVDFDTAEHERLQALTAVVHSAGGRGKYLLRSILDDDPNRVWNAVAAEGRHAALVEQYRGLLDADEQATFDAVTSQLQPLRPDLLSQMRDFSLTSFDTALIEAAVTMLYDHGDYLVSLDAYAHDMHAQMERDAIAKADVAAANLHRTWLLLFSIGAITLGLIALGSFATLAPLRRLTRRAEAISAGNIDAAPLPIRGPTDVRSLTRTTNEMIAVLGQVDSEVRRLADGVVDDGYEVDLPGALGDSLQGSMNRLHDITRQLQRSEQLASAIVAGAGDAIWTVDASGRIVSANDASYTLVGIAPRDQQGHMILDYLSSIAGEATVRSQAGSDWPVLVSTSTIESADETVSVVIAHDISERLDFEQQLAMQARRDPLTGLPNRLAVIERIRDLADARLRAAVLYLDLDGFKSVNDLRGHSVGDDVLAEVGRRLRSTVGATDLVGRLGGDEFIVVSTTMLRAAEIDRLGARLIGVVEQPFTSEDLINLSASIGVVILDGHHDAETVLSEADSALYQAKNRGKGRLEVFDRALQESVAHQTELELALRRAIPNGELVLHLQPIIDVRTNRVDGAEALVRWNRPGHGLVSPNDFIPLAERSSLIIDLDRWVIQQCCDRLARWRRRHVDADLRLAVNISGRHLMDGNLVADVDAALTRSGADPSMLEIELTETHLLGDLERAVASLKSLRERGVRVSIDDFGTGYSAMNYLRKLPIDAIKIDRSFVDAATSSAADASVVDAVMAIGRSHGLEVVAEGIETEEHLSFVRDRGCNRAQGFLIARPMPADDAEDLLFSHAAMGAR